MSYAPEDLLDVRGYLMTRTGLPAVSLGIVGDSAHNGGYHCGRDRITSTDYSWAESARDRANASDAASALDIGLFDVTINGRRVTLRSLSLAIVDACQRGDSRAADIREVIYSPDGVAVRRWDRLGIRSTGDTSHRSHTHLSFFRDSEGRRAQAGNLLGLLRSSIEGDTGMELSDTIPGTGSAGNPADRNISSLLGDEFRTLQGSARRVGPDGRYDLAGMWPESPITELVLGVRELLDRPAAVLTDEQAAAMTEQVLAALPAIVRAEVRAALADTHLAVSPS